MNSVFDDLGSLKQFVAIRREAIVFSLAKYIHARLQQAPRTTTTPTEDQWIGIESLSQLRGLVGGRFVTVKSHWVAAGFPLRAHRGDRSEQSNRDIDGWATLCHWLEELGFEARISSGLDAVCFEIRQKPGK